MFGMPAHINCAQSRLNIVLALVPGRFVFPNSGPLSLTPKNFSLEARFYFSPTRAARARLAVPAVRSIEKKLMMRESILLIQQQWRNALKHHLQKSARQRSYTLKHLLVLHCIAQLIVKKSKNRCKQDFSRSATSVGIHIISAILADAECAVDWP
jgi:hypothetical protein